MHRYGLYVDGAWVPAEEKRMFQVYNPATGDMVGMVADASEADVARAIDAAHGAFFGWASRTAKERSEILRRAYDLMLKRMDDLAVILTTEQGKPISEARAEIQYAADFILWYAEEAKRVYGETIPASRADKRIIVLRQPVGVVGVITPWNFPAAMITRKIGPALAAGCTVVIKPAEQTPLTACRLVEILEEAGAPRGVVNMVPGSQPEKIVNVMLRDERVRKLTFTGSTEVGKLLMRRAADGVKRLSLELGGHAPFLIFEDADIEAAAREVAASKFRNAGQTCICANRVYIHEAIIEPFAHALAERARKMRIGNGLDDGVVIGPLIDQHAADKVENHVRDAVNKGANIVTGGHRIRQQGVHKEVNFFEPTVLTEVTDDMILLKEETFGPVAPLQTFRNEEEVVRKANNTRYGLAAYLFTRDLSRAIRVAEGLEYGVVGVNDGLPSAAQAPFGGYKESGLGREGGRYGIDEYLELKYISLALG